MNINSNHRNVASFSYIAIPLYVIKYKGNLIHPACSIILQNQIVYLLGKMALIQEWRTFVGRRVSMMDYPMRTCMHAGWVCMTV